MKLTMQAIISKCKDMLSISNNRPLFLYRVHHYLKRNVSQKTAQRYAKNNKLFYENKNIDVLWLETYDGSNQVCHPDIAYWNNEYWLVATPYPYGLEEYENPSLFHGVNINSLIGIDANPIAFPGRKGYGSHLSDPCLYKHDDTLYCFYRDTINYGEKIENRICYKMIERDGVTDGEQLLVSSFVDGLLSPSVIQYRDSTFLLLVSSVDGNLVFKGYSLTKELNICSEFSVDVCGKEQEWDIWHFDLKVKNDSLVEGLFLMREKNNKGNFKLKKANLDIETRKLFFSKDVTIPEEISTEILFPYKSCIIPGVYDKAIMSFRDKNSVYVLKVIDI